MRKICIVAIFISLFLAMPSYTSMVDTDNNMNSGVLDLKDNAFESNVCENGTEYWALIVAVGVYANNPDMDRPSMLVESEKLRKMLPVSSNWDESHIKVITEENATVPNIIEGFRWLDEMEDEDDICLIYLTTHGFPIIFDLPPFDESDGMDEALATYRGFLPFQSPWSWEPLANPFAILTDDEINFLLNRLESKGIGLIVDSCHSGGFNDNWSYSRETAEDWVEGFAGELQGRNRVIVTSVPESETSYGSYFTDYLIEGLQGYSDSNGDGICSLEEAFYYAKPRIERETGMHPQIFDDYPGELPITEKELPPSQPGKPEGELIGKTNTTYTYKISSYDPEGDRIKYLVDWGDGNEEWTDFYPSGEVVNISHSWSVEGTYDISVMAEDERGAEGEWSESQSVTMTHHHTVDQRQVEREWIFHINNTRWCAQSFVPTLDSISKIELGAVAWETGRNLIVSLRDRLDGDDLAIEEANMDETDWNVKWISFEFPAVNVIPGNTYYIICRSSNEGWGTGWAASGGNPYENGDFYTSYDAGGNWEKPDWDEVDGCFVTYK